MSSCVSYNHNDALCNLSSVGNAGCSGLVNDFCEFYFKETAWKYQKRFVSCKTVPLGDILWAELTDDESQAPNELYVRANQSYWDRKMHVFCIVREVERNGTSSRGFIYCISYYCILFIAFHTIVLNKPC